MAPKDVILGVLGGSGVYQMDGVKVLKEHEVSTPFGIPSDKVIEIEYDGRKFFFLSRHGRGHKLLPSEINYRANIYALKSFGVTHLMAVSAVGIMEEQISPGDMVIPDQIFDRTKGIRESSFFGEGVVGHVTFADPFNREMSDLIEKAAKNKTPNVHRGGAYICMEGPQFSTRAESHFYRQTIRPSIIGMTGIPEAKLAREAEMCYGMLALATDFDCWHETENDIEVTDVLKVLKDNASLANEIVKRTVSELPNTSSNEALSAAKFAIITHPEFIPDQKKKDLDLLYGKYLK